MLSSQPPKTCVLVITGHDYRCAPRGTVHFLVDQLTLRGDVKVFTPGISTLLRFKGALSKQARSLSYNTRFTHNNAECFVWRTPIHPFNPRNRLLTQAARAGFQLYRKFVPPVLSEWARSADTIIVESGLPVLFLETLATANPKAKLVYFSSDSMETIGCDPYLTECLENAAAKLSWACILSPSMASIIPERVRTVLVPQGVDASIIERAGTSPFGSGQHAVSIGAMLFDPWVFEVLAPAFPDVTFHVIGSQSPKNRFPAGVEWYPTLPFEQLPAYLKHADVGIAPYRECTDGEYLQDTSLKLIQYGLFGLPGVCPEFAAGTKPLRFGYQPANATSLVTAFEAALNCRDRTPVPGASWSDVTDLVLAPKTDSDSSN